MTNTVSSTRGQCAPGLSRWERAYRAFETPDEELRKFVRRLRGIGADDWDRRSRVLEVCSGRGSGLRAWTVLGFHNLLGVDYSQALLRSEDVPGTRIVGDARDLPLTSGSIHIAVVQGGLHHLLSTADVRRALQEMCRVVGPSGTIVIIEPWLTPFLRLVHFVCDQPLARHISPRIDALATMIEEERDTYERWLRAPAEHLTLILRHVRPRLIRRRWGKLVVVGSPVVES